MTPRQRVAAGILAAAIGIPSFALFYRAPLCDSDVGWHLAFGEYIVRHHTIPARDVFRFTPQEAALHLHGWLAHVVFCGLERIGGLNGFRFGTAAVMLGTLFLVTRVFYKMSQSVHLTALGVLLFFLTSVHLFHPRARIFTPFLFLLAFEQLLKPAYFRSTAASAPKGSPAYQGTVDKRQTHPSRRSQEKGPPAHEPGARVPLLTKEGEPGLDPAPLSARRLMGLFVLAVVWMNLHAEAMVLPFFIVVLLLSEGLTRPFPRRRIISLGLAAALTTAALFVSPLGASWLTDALQNYHINRENSVEWYNLFAYQAAVNPFLSSVPREYYPMYVHLLGYPFPLWLTIAVAASYFASLALRRERPAGVPGVLVNLWALALAFNMQRNSWLLVIPIASTLRMISLRACRFGSRLHGATPAPRHRWTALVTTAALLLLTALTLREVVRPGLWLKYDDNGWDARMFPTKAVAFMDAAKLHGNTFSQAEWGGYLVYKRPDLVFMHGHWAEAPRTYADYQMIFQQHPGFAELLERYGTTLIVAPPWWGARLPVAQWVEVFRNAQSRIYVRRDDDANLASVEAYYRSLGIPFLRGPGFDPERAAATAPTWARAFRLQM